MKNSFGIRILGFGLWSTHFPLAVAHGLAWFEPYGLIFRLGFDLVFLARVLIYWIDLWLDLDRDLALVVVVSVPRPYGSVWQFLECSGEPNPRPNGLWFKSL